MTDTNQTHEDAEVGRLLRETVCWRLQRREFGAFVAQSLRPGGLVTGHGIGTLEALQSLSDELAALRKRREDHIGQNNP